MSRIVRLAIDDVIRDGDTVLLRLGESPSPIPVPVADLPLEHTGTVTSEQCDGVGWLLPGRRAGRPARPDHLSALLDQIGVPATAARSAAICRQLLGMPAPVVADALGYHHETPSRLRKETGSTWSRYRPRGPRKANSGLGSSEKRRQSMTRAHQ
ncbi:hypothetical protein ACFW34_29535 [Streptomyces sp. NPDC058848]|uniref:hypothetical protein n=1 Tax=unclassified Streptomyces TaxID=2593676 RepID=UPI0036747B4E